MNSKKEDRVSSQSSTGGMGMSNEALRIGIVAA